MQKKIYLSLRAGALIAAGFAIKPNAQAQSCSTEDEKTLQRSILEFRNHQCDTFTSLPVLSQLQSPSMNEHCRIYTRHFERCQEQFTAAHAQLFCSSYYRPVGIEGKSRSDLCAVMSRYPVIVPAAWLYCGYDPTLVPAFLALANAAQAQVLAASLRLKGMDFSKDSKFLTRIQSAAEAACVEGKLTPAKSNGIWNSVKSKVTSFLTSFDSAIEECLDPTNESMPGHH